MGYYIVSQMLFLFLWTTNFCWYFVHFYDNPDLLPNRIIYHKDIELRVLVDFDFKLLKYDITIDCCGLKSGGSVKTESKEECYQSLTKEGYYVPGSDSVPKFDIEFDYKEPEEVSPCLRVTNTTWEILVSSAHLRPTYSVVSDV